MNCLLLLNILMFFQFGSLPATIDMKLPFWISESLTWCWFLIQLTVISFLFYFILISLLGQILLLAGVVQVLNLLFSQRHELTGCQKRLEYRGGMDWLCISFLSLDSAWRRQCHIYLRGLEFLLLVLSDTPFSLL